NLHRKRFVDPKELSQRFLQSFRSYLLAVHHRQLALASGKRHVYCICIGGRAFRHANSITNGVSPIAFVLTHC
ncbi:MAG: hypothetical protein QGF59_13450, partial [Pirellulaceae bacterium]|nr:hypothetical protein [Pirellulaceae bacterium]